MNHQLSGPEDRFNERLAIMREANNIPDQAPTPPEMLAIAQAQKEQDEKEAAR